MTAHVGRAGRAPSYVTFFGPILKFLLAAGVPLGLNGLITIPGRKTGLPRTTPVAIIKVADRRWIWAPWGEVQWVQNLRAAGHATLTFRRRDEEVAATELDQAQRAEFFRDVMAPIARSFPLGVWLVRLVDGVDVNRPEEVAVDRRVFELHADSSL
jgi:deazaflavin-dependent oxidoreductase (nitroreductase family)